MNNCKVPKEIGSRKINQTRTKFLSETQSLQIQNNSGFCSICIYEREKNMPRSIMR